ncbi:hypothetical protein EMPS_05357 [Entomortierella parvispora]|uniref:Uncharacterized protein n=1 Tax=Entomortierella parvispora TaxID=205924 RepID=A0A9P3LWF3_9FUNG|nr:hypothetical protein EMPS_05357 [Entomortierella parvispora]
MTSAPGRPDRSMDWFANLKEQQIATLSQTWDALEKIPSQSEIQFLGTVTRLQEDQVLWWFHARANHASVSKVFQQRRREGASENDTLILPALKEHALFQRYRKGDPIRQREITKKPDACSTAGCSTAGVPGPAPKRKPGPKSARTARSKAAAAPAEPAEPTEPIATKRRREATGPISDKDEPTASKIRNRRAQTPDRSSTTTPSPKRIRSSASTLTDSTRVAVSSLLIRVESTEPAIEEDLVMESGKIITTTSASPKVLGRSATSLSPEPDARKQLKTTRGGFSKEGNTTEVKDQDNGENIPEEQTEPTTSRPRRGTRNRRHSHPTSTTQDNDISNNLKPAPVAEEVSPSTTADTALTTEKSTGLRRRGRSVARAAETNPIAPAGTRRRGRSTVRTTAANNTTTEPAVTQQHVSGESRVVETSPGAEEITETCPGGQSTEKATGVNSVLAKLVTTRQRSRSAARVTEGSSTQASPSHERGRSKVRVAEKAISLASPKTPRTRGRSKATETRKITPTQLTGSTEHEQSMSGVADAVFPSSEPPDSRRRSRSTTRASWVDDLNMYAAIVPKFRTKISVASSQEPTPAGVETVSEDSGTQFSASIRDPRIAYGSPDVASATTANRDTLLLDMSVDSAQPLLSSRVVIPLFPVLHPGLSSDPRISHAVHMGPIPQPLGKQEIERLESRGRDAVRREQERERLEREDEERDEMERILRQSAPMERPWTPSPKSLSRSSPNSCTRSPTMFETIPSLATPPSLPENIRHIRGGSKGHSDAFERPFSTLEPPHPLDTHEWNRSPLGTQPANQWIEPSGPINIQLGSTRKSSESWIDPSRGVDDSWNKLAGVHRRSNDILDQHPSTSSHRQIQDDHRTRSPNGRQSQDGYHGRNDSRTYSRRESRYERREGRSRSRSDRQSRQERHESQSREDRHENRSEVRSDRESRHEHGDGHSRDRSDRHSRQEPPDSRSRDQSDRNSRHEHGGGHSRDRSDRHSRQEPHDSRSRDQSDRKSRRDHGDSYSRDRSDRKSRHERPRSHTHNKSRRDRQTGRSRSRSPRRSHRRSRHTSHSSNRHSSLRQASPRQSPPRESSSSHYEHHSSRQNDGDQNMGDIAASRHHQGPLQHAQPIVDIAEIIDAPQILMVAEKARSIRRSIGEVEHACRESDLIMELEEKTDPRKFKDSEGPKVLTIKDRDMTEQPPTIAAEAQLDVKHHSEAEGSPVRQSSSHSTRNYRSRQSSPAVLEADLQYGDRPKPLEAPTDAPVQVPLVVKDRPPKSSQIQRMSMPDLETLASSVRQHQSGIESTAKDENNSPIDPTVHSRQSSSASTSTLTSISSSTSTSTASSTGPLARHPPRQSGLSADSPGTDEPGVPEESTEGGSKPKADIEKVVPVPQTATGIPERPRRKKKGMREIRDD